jgi:hypothetical protein
VQVMQQPSSVGSHLHIPIARVQQHIIIPFMMQQQLHIPPAIIEQRFCSMVADILSSHLQIIFMPPVHFSMVILHRGTIIQFGAVGIAVAVPIPAVWPVPIPGIPMPARSITIALVIEAHLSLVVSVFYTINFLASVPQWRSIIQIASEISISTFKNITNRRLLSCSEWSGSRLESSVSGLTWSS